MRLCRLVTTSTLLIFLAACNDDGRELRPADPDKTASISVPATSSTVVEAVVPALDDGGDEPPQVPFKVQLPWDDGGIIGAQYSCIADNVAPPVTWLSPPAGAVEMALVVEDLDADNFVHWVIAGLDPLDPVIPQGSVPLGAIEAANDFSTAEVTDIGWSGPCPPHGTTHRYRFTLYALDQQVELAPGSPADDLIAVINNSSMAAAQLTATFGR